MSLMNIVTQIENKINNITNFSDLTDAAQFASSEIATAIFLETIKSVDDKFFRNGSWKELYTSNGFVWRHIITPLSKISFKRRYYMSKDKNQHDNFYYVDKVLEIPPYKRISKEALADILNMAVEVNGSYAAKNAILGVKISKQTVSNYIRSQNIMVDNLPVIDDIEEGKPLEFDVIYIEADEAHVNLQKDSKTNSSDEIKTTPTDKRICRSKNIIDKLVLSHTGHINEHLRLKRKELGNKHYFGGINVPSIDLSDNVYGYISTRYDLSKVKYVFVSGDGASWINTLSESLKSTLRSYQDITVIQVLDKFHMAKYLNSIFGHDQNTLKYIRKIIYTITPERFRMITDAYFAFSKKRNIKEDKFNQKVEYIINNLQKIRNQKHPFYRTPCSMEGHVSHVLANRLTSRPKGFCEPVLHNLTQMIILKQNGKDITPEMLDTWSKVYTVPDKPKYVSLTKTYKNNYSVDVHMPALDSTNTNLKRFLTAVKNNNYKI